MSDLKQFTFALRRIKCFAQTDTIYNRDELLKHPVFMCLLTYINLLRKIPFKSLSLVLTENNQ